MANSETRRQLTERDLEILLAIDRCPLTVNQLLKLSKTFSGQGFQSLRSCHERLRKLRDAGWVRSWAYATTGHGSSPAYFKTTPLGFRLIHRDETSPVAARDIAEALQACAEGDIAQLQFRRTAADVRCWAEAAANYARQICDNANDAAFLYSFAGIAEVQRGILNLAEETRMQVHDVLRHVATATPGLRDRESDREEDETGRRRVGD